MEESLEREVHRCARSKKGLGVIMADIDHFKAFNDKYGHDAGDIVLVEFAKLLTSSFRSSDVVCRYGGEEFIIIMPESDKFRVVQRAEELCKHVSELELLYAGKALPQVTASFGASYVECAVIDKADLLKAADMALYDAKAAGRNQVVLSNIEFTDTAE